MSPSDPRWSETETDDYRYHGICTVVPCGRHRAMLGPQSITAEAEK